MTAARRRIVRPTTPSTSDQSQQRKLQSVRTRLARERTALDRWWKRLKRALNATMKHQHKVRALERQLTQLAGEANGQTH